MARLLRQYPQTGHSSLGKPFVIFAPQEAFGWAAVSLAPSRRPRLTHPALRPAGVVSAPAPGETFEGSKTPLVAIDRSLRRARRAISVLSPPMIIGAAVGDIFDPIVGKLTPLLGAADQHRRPRTISLRPPEVVGEPVTAVFYGPVATLAPSRITPRVMAGVRTPVFVSAAVAYEQVRVTLAASGRGRPTSVLSPPIVIGAGVISAPLQVSLFPLSPRRLAAQHKLSAPVVVGIPAQPLAAAIHLAQSRRGIAKSRLLVPPVIGAGIVFAPISGKLTPLSGAADQHFRLTTTFLSRPEIIESAGEIFFGPSAILTYSRRPRTKWGLGAPAVVLVVIEPHARPIATSLAASSYGVAKSNLLPPAVVGAGIVFAPLQVFLAPFWPRRLTAQHRLSLPIVVGIPAQPLAAIKVTLVAVRTGVEQILHRTMAGVRTPIFVRRTVVYESVRVVLAAQSRGRSISFLTGPVVVGAQGFFGPSVALAASLRGTTKSVLAPPAVVALGAIQPITIFLAFATRPQAKSFLIPPAIVAPEAVTEPVRPIMAALAFSGRPQSKSFLLPPTVVASDVIHASLIQLFLLPPRRQLVLHKLRPPVVVQPLTLVFPGPTTTFAQASRGLAKPFLSPPAVIGAGIVFAPIQGWLTYATDIPYRRQPFSVLSPPAAVSPPGEAFYGPAVTLTYSRRLRAKWGLGAPAVVFVLIEVLPRQLSVNLTYSRRGRAYSQILPPAVVGTAIVHRPVQVNLSYSRRGLAKPFLIPPSVVGQIVFYGPAVTLAPSKRGVPSSLLKQPTVVAQPFVAAPIRVTLTTITVPLANAWIKPPTAVNEPEISYAQIVTWLIRIHPPKTHWTLKPPTAIRPAAPTGDVCGDDSTDSNICGEVTGVESIIVGTDTSGGDVCGTDSEAT